MNNVQDPYERKSGELARFAIGFFGFVFGAAGIVIGSIPLTIAGGVLMAIGIVPFALKHYMC